MTCILPKQKYFKGQFKSRKLLHLKFIHEFLVKRNQSSCKSTFKGNIKCSVDLASFEMIIL